MSYEFIEYYWFWWILIKKMQSDFFLFNSDHKTSLLSLLIYNLMRKKDSHHQNATSNKVPSLHMQMFVINSAFKHFERDKIDSVSVCNFNNLVHSISLRILKNSTEAEIIELFKVTNDLIVGFLANLSE